eukprot:TRINITY_DN3606_c0_g1_i26.p2 TRINITY_DN3606_c0_g1~~TRINITY_DN3606_c0_g1_i26.p2  ORF type:complete len:102 (-),score=26.80 TRINITY_DN3606_c0_g1_i26:347-652(-)
MSEADVTSRHHRHGEEDWNLPHAVEEKYDLAGPDAACMFEEPNVDSAFHEMDITQSNSPTREPIYSRGDDPDLHNEIQMLSPHLAPVRLSDEEEEIVEEEE